MRELITIRQNNDGTQAVSARDLYLKLGFDKTHWKRWYEKNITKNQFAIENEDWQVLAIMARSKKTKDFALSLDFAKRLCMLARTEVGEKVRQYFIQCEKKAKTMDVFEVMMMNIKRLQEQDRAIKENHNRIVKLEAKATTRPDYFTIAGYGNLHNISVNIKLASKLGRKASAICRHRGLQTDTTPDPRFGEVKMYPTKVLDEVFESEIIG